MKNTVSLFAFAFLSLSLASFILPKNNIITVYINGKTIPDNTILTHEQNSDGIVLQAKIPSGARFNELKFTLPSKEVGNYPINAKSKAKITYSTTFGDNFNSQSHTDSKGFIKVIASTDNSLQIEFECMMSNGKQKLVMKTGKVQLNF